MENENMTEQNDDFITVPKGTTVNKEKYERQVQRANDAEERAKSLEQQIADLTASSDADKKALEDFQKKIADESAKYDEQKKLLEQQIAQKDLAIELQKSGCIDTESAIASMHNEMTIEQLKEAKPHLFHTSTKPSSLDPSDPPADSQDDSLRKAFGLI